MNRLVLKCTIRRIKDIAENEELRTRKRELEMASESDNEEWRDLVHAHLDDMRIMNSEDGEKIKRDFDRIMRGI